MSKKIDLTLLKKLVTELDSTLSIVDGMQTNLSVDKSEVVVELARALGITATILTESSLLMGDIQFVISGPAAAPSKADLDSLLKSLKLPGGSN